MNEDPTDNSKISLSVILEGTPDKVPASKQSITSSTLFVL